MASPTATLRTAVTTPATPPPRTGALSSRVCVSTRMMNDESCAHRGAIIMKRLLPECVQMRRATTSAVAAPAQTVEEYSATPGFRLSHATPWHLKTRYFVFRMATPGRLVFFCALFCRCLLAAESEKPCAGRMSGTPLVTVLSTSSTMQVHTPAPWPESWLQSLPGDRASDAAVRYSPHWTRHNLN